jgi:hypothetical protein
VFSDSLLSISDMNQSGLTDILWAGDWPVCRRFVFNPQADMTESLTNFFTASEMPAVFIFSYPPAGLSFIEATVGFFSDLCAFFAFLAVIFLFSVTSVS